MSKCRYPSEPHSPDCLLRDAPHQAPQWESVTFGLDRLSVPGGWLYRQSRQTGERSYVTEAMTFVPAPSVREQELVEALRDCVEIVDAAGLQNLTRGVQLGPTVWFVKATERFDHARVVLGIADEVR